MSTGTSNDYWAKRNLPSTFKHELLRVYLPVFMARLSSVSEVAYIDGFAGAGRYEDGSPGSAEMSIKFASDLAKSRGRKFHLHYREKDADSFEKLTSVLAENTHPNLVIDARRGDISIDLGGILENHRSHPLLAFLDPCGFGVPYELLVKTMNRDAYNKPTELLLNFSHEAFRRSAGAKEGQAAAAATHKRITDAVGGDWWKSLFKEHKEGDDFGEVIAREFAKRLVSDTKASVCIIPVKRSPTTKTIYSLVHVTRSGAAAFRMYDAVSRAHEKWWMTFESMEEPEDNYALFEAPRQFDMNEHIKNTKPQLKENIIHLLHEGKPFEVSAVAPSILGSNLGSIPDKAIRQALVELEKEGIITIEYRKKKVEYWQIQQTMHS
ncbi:three-Cys-motif partner protein TcmP [Corynebacterium callunae]|uniref:three-Cys-motif partner protein TcmP n=1 Tax=Corynebacterium callunae TaxID=1721 RepID=UPI0039824909